MPRICKRRGTIPSSFYIGIGLRSWLPGFRLVSMNLNWALHEYHQCIIWNLDDLSEINVINKEQFSLKIPDSKHKVKMT